MRCSCCLPPRHGTAGQLATRSPSWSRERRQSSGTCSQAGQCISTNQMQSPNRSAAYTHTTVERSRWQSYEESVSVSAINHAHALPACALSSPRCQRAPCPPLRAASVRPVLLSALPACALSSLRQVFPKAAVPSAVLHGPLLVSLLSSTATSTPLPSLSASRRCQLGRCMGRRARCRCVTWAAGRAPAPAWIAPPSRPGRDCGS